MKATHLAYMPLYGFNVCYDETKSKETEKNECLFNVTINYLIESYQD